MPIILLASNNHGKLYEIQSLFNSLPGEEPAFSWLRQVTLMLPDDLNLALEVVEDGQTYAENARLKAEAFNRACLKQVSSGRQIVVLADDSGLEVAALGGAPGIHSARFAPPGADIPAGRAGDAPRRAHLLRQLQPFPPPWQAHFHCTIALACGDAPLRYVSGECHGVIQSEERGSAGFGYDPIFFLPQLGKTMAELSTEEKNRLSHRARAVRAAVPVLYDLFRSLGEFNK